MSRFLSLLVAGAYCLVVAMNQESMGPNIARFVVWLLLCLGCIWFGDALGESEGRWGLGPSINAPSPGFLVKGMGWVLLLFPVWLPFLYRFLMGEPMKQ